MYAVNFVITFQARATSNFYVSCHSQKLCSIHMRKVCLYHVELQFKFKQWN